LNPDGALLRSLLFAPGSQSRKLEKVGGFGLDAIVLDLEDAVADAEKDEAGSLIVHVTRTPRRARYAETFDAVRVRVVE
jgi:citrate lyase beta subunit